MAIDYQKMINDGLAQAEEARKAKAAQEAKAKAEQEKQEYSRARVKDYLEELLKYSGLTGDYDSRVVQLYVSSSPDPIKAYISVVYDILSHPLLGFRLGSDGLSFRGKVFDHVSGLKGVHGEIVNLIDRLGLIDNDLWLHLLLQAVVTGMNKDVAVSLAVDWAKYRLPQVPTDITMEDLNRLVRAGVFNPMV